MPEKRTAAEQTDLYAATAEAAQMSWHDFKASYYATGTTNTTADVDLSKLLADITAPVTFPAQYVTPMTYSTTNVTQTANFKIDAIPYAKQMQSLLAKYEGQIHTVNILDETEAITAAKAERVRAVEANPGFYADLADKAHDAILVDGWVQGRMHSDGGSHCTWGAIDIAVLGNSRREANNLTLWISDKMLDGVSVPAWNDDPRRTLDDVLDLLRNTAKRLRAIEQGG